MKKFLLALAIGLVGSGVSASTVLINEFAPNPPGSDPSNTTLELLGAAGDSFSGVAVTIDGDTVSPRGVVNEVIAISGMFDANGILALTVPDFENPTFTLLIAGATSVSSGDDLDTDNDGFLDDTSVFSSIMDAIGVTDGGAGDLLYANQLGGTDLIDIGDEPQLVFRDGGNPDVIFALEDNGGAQERLFNALTGEQVGLFDDGFNTFGAVNPSIVPLPATGFMLFGALGGLALVRRHNSRG